MSVASSESTVDPKAHEQHLQDLWIEEQLGPLPDIFHPKREKNFYDVDTCRCPGTGLYDSQDRWWTTLAICRLLSPTTDCYAAKNAIKNLLKNEEYKHWSLLHYPRTPLVTFDDLYIMWVGYGMLNNSHKQEIVEAFRFFKETSQDRHVPYHFWEVLHLHENLRNLNEYVFPHAENYAEEQANLPN